MTLSDMALHGWRMPRGMLQKTRDDIDRQVEQTSQQLKEFPASHKLIDGKLHSIPSPEGERVALAAVRCAWDGAPLERDEVQDWNGVVTELFRLGSFSDYSEAIRSLIGELESETASRLSQPNQTGRARSFGANLNRLRSNEGWSLEKLAEKAKVKKSLVVRHITHGKGAHPTTKNKYADALRVSVEELDRQAIFCYRNATDLGLTFPNPLVHTCSCNGHERNSNH